MRRAAVVALNTFREAVRDRVLYNLVFFALLMMVAAIAVGQISIGIEQIVIVSLGLSAISVIALLISVFLGVALVSKEMDKRTLYVLLAVYFILLKLALIVALALLFSCFTTPLLAILFTAGLYIVGLYVQELRNLPMQVMSPVMAAFTRWLSYVLPNFENFNVMAMAAHGRVVPGTLILQNTLYTVIYCTIVLIAAAAVFARKNLK